MRWPGEVMVYYVVFLLLLNHNWRSQLLCAALIELFHGYIFSVLIACWIFWGVGGAERIFLKKLEVLVAKK